jgi:acyl carrier protein
LFLQAGGIKMVFDTVKRIISEELGVKEEEVKLESDLSEDLGADSLDAVELIMALEEEFDISVSDEKAQELKSVQDIVSYLEEVMK